MHEEEGQLTFFDLGIWSGKTFPELSPLPREKISAQSLKKPAELYTADYLFLNLQEGFGDLLGPYWEINSPWLGEYWTLNTGASPKDAKESSLLQILEDSPPLSFYLSKTTCLKLLRRMEKLNQYIPAPLRQALEIQAELVPQTSFLHCSSPSSHLFTESYCIKGNSINRQDHNGGNGRGLQKNICYTLTTVDRHCVFAYTLGDETATYPNDEVPNQVVLPNGFHSGIRYLTPLECERLMGFPNYWTALEGASNNARYEALGNSVAIPCVKFVLQGIALYTVMKQHLAPRYRN